MDSSLVAQLALNGVLLGLVYGLVGLGLALVLGIMGVLNIAHGAFYMLAGYISYLIAVQFGLSPVIGVLAAVGAIFFIGMAVDQLFVGRAENDPTRVMMITFGIAIVIEQIAIIKWGGNPATPPAFSNLTLSFAGLYMQTQLLIASSLGVILAILTIFFLRLSKVGKAMRMVSQNKEMAGILGVSTKKISAISLGLGSCYAGIAGALLTPVYNVYPDSQWQPLVAAFVVVVVGGLGSISGSMIGGLIYGMLESFGSYYLPAASDIMVLVLIVAIILVRPYGLFGQKDRI
jgi:branched-chain amino acid transport system permease protein